ncbi:MAG: primosomal protein N' [Gammaproteobacteria bacterium]|nr:primosomal protein N' [Gammaproteobacteria bacterium]
MSSFGDKGYKGLVYKVAVPSPLRRIFDYLPPASGEKIEPGTRVQINFGQRKIVGFVISQADQSGLSKNKLKPILTVIDSEPTFPDKLFRFLQWCAHYYQHPIGEVLNTATPVKLRSARALYQEVSTYHLVGSFDDSQLQALDRAPKQKTLIDFLARRKNVSKQEILDQGYSTSIINTLKHKALIECFQTHADKPEPFPPLIDPSPKALPLNQEQQLAVDKIRSGGNAFNCFLLDGVTGSGKTEVYMQIMADQLREGRQCLILVPEIGLTPQTVSRFQQRFNCPLSTLHSGMTDNERLGAWSQARDGAVGIVIGTRSAIFTPLPNPGLIIIDEEHDGSFKQQDGFRYSARDLAVMRGREENVPVILGSATPSLESLLNAQANKFTHLSLVHRAGGASDSITTVVDTANEYLESGLSEQLLFKIDQHLSANNQVLLFINRRGYAPVLSCSQCSWIAECDECVSQLTVHAQPPSIRCHHCGVAHHLPNHCPQCNSATLKTSGIGTQKLEKYLAERFSDYPVIRIDRDSARSKRKFDVMLEQIHSGEPCILLGTQMLAKGHHFPNITLVAIVDADSGLFSPDFRGQEFMIQTLVQVSGRAGRADRPGEVVIQSRHAAHKALTQLTQSTYREIAQSLLDERREAAMPPFSQLTLVRAEGSQLRHTMDLLKRVNEYAIEIIQPSQSQIQVLGPVPAPMEKKAGRFRSHLLFKAETKSSMQQFLTQLVYQLENIKLSRGLRLSIDVDPMEMI